MLRKWIYLSMWYYSYRCRFILLLCIRFWSESTYSLFSTLHIDCEVLSFQYFPASMQNYISSTKRVGWDNVEEINKNWTTLLDKNKRRMGQTYSIYIGNLPQNERSEDPLQYKKDWKKKYDEFVKQHLAENQWSDPLSVQQALNAFSIHI